MIVRTHKRLSITQNDYIKQRLNLKSCTDCTLYDKCIQQYNGSPLLKGITSCDKFNPNTANIILNYKTLLRGT